MDISLPVHVSAVGLLKQFLRVVTSVVVAVHVLPSHLPARTVGRAVDSPYAPI